MADKIKGAAVVLTGASSGIGRATAHAFARRGARLVLAARRDELLQEVADECALLGGQAVVVPTDMTDEGAVQALARRAREAFGRIDVWVNNHGVYQAARFDEVPTELYLRVFETDLFGVVYGSRAALPIFREQGRGVLINLGSVFSLVTAPYFSAYSAAKHAVRAIGASLRQELLVTGERDIHVCTVMPATIDTPIFQHAANTTGRALKPFPPITPPERVARAIVGLAERPRRELIVGRGGGTLALQQRLAPAATERALAHIFDRLHLDEDEPQPPTDGNLLEPMHRGRGASGGWRRGGRSLGRLGLAALAALPAMLLWRRRRAQ